MIRFLFNPKFHSIFLGITGPNQSGKTVTAIYFVRCCHELGLFKHFGLNIPDLKLGFDYDFIEDQQTLQERCEALGTNGKKRYLFVGDEMGDWAPQDQSWLNVKFIQELQQVRKYGLSFIGCGIDRIDKRILSPSFFNGILKKFSKLKPDTAMYYDWTHYPAVTRYQVSGLPNQIIEGFNTWKKYYFYMTKQNPNVREYEADYLTLYRDFLQHDKSWKALGVHPQEGKRAKEKVLSYLWQQYEQGKLKDQGQPQIT